MRLLLDTHLLLCAAASSRRLPPVARRLIEDRENEVFYSAASLWEIAIKAALRKADFEADVALLRPALAEMDSSNYRFQATMQWGSPASLRYTRIRSTACSSPKASPNLSSC